MLKLLNKIIDKLSLNSNRKLYLALICIKMMFLGALLCAWKDNFKIVYEIYVMGIGAIYATYSGMNIGSKFVQGKNSAGSDPKSQPIEPLPPE